MGKAHIKRPIRSLTLNIKMELNVVMMEFASVLVVSNFWLQNEATTSTVRPSVVLTNTTWHKNMTLN
jgi:intracellular septation protein A